MYVPSPVRLTTVLFGSAILTPMAAPPFQSQRAASACEYATRLSGAQMVEHGFVVCHPFNQKNRIAVGMVTNPRCQVLRRNDV